MPGDRGVAGAPAVAAPWQRAAGQSLVSLLNLAPGQIAARHCVWHLGRLSAASPNLDAAAWLLADEMMRGRCGAARRTYDLWHARATGGLPLSPVEREMVEQFVEPSIGLPGHEKSRDHLEGAVAEYIWYLVARDRVEPHRVMRHLEKPSLLASEPGGDGLAIYERVADGSLAFRLWEVKKHTGSGDVSGVITRACTQLAARGKKYFAKYASQGELLPDADLVDLYGELGERWIRSHESAGAGVAVAISEARAPRRAFSQMHRHLPQLRNGDQLEGLIAAVGDFATFALRVREFLWSGL